MRTLALVFKFRFVFEQLVREKINRGKTESSVCIIN